MQNYKTKVLILGMSVFGLLILGRIGILLVFDYYKVTYKGSLFLLFLTVFLPFIIGLLLGVLSLINDESSLNVGTINWTALIYLGIPALLFSLFPLLHRWLMFSFQLNKYTSILWNENFYGITALILGYVIVYSIFRR